MKKRALISVFNKDKIVEFAQELTQKYDYEIIATGSTYDILKENNVQVTEITEITGKRQLINGKVKTLYPDIFAGILADMTNEKEKSDIEAGNIKLFDMVVVNFYPFEEAVQKEAEESELINSIDIGGPSMLRAAAKNNKRVLAVSSISQYPQVLADLKDHDGNSSLKLRREFALKVFEKTLDFDTKILHELSNRFEEDTDNYFSLNIKKSKNLRYGENPHQTAGIYYTNNTIDYEVLNGKELSYNNILDVTACTNILSEFYDVSACVIIKHNTPCGAALGKDTEEAWKKALDCDPLSAFGGIVGFTQVINETVAKQLTSMFLEVIVAPDYTPKSLEIQKQKKNLRVIKLNTSLIEYKNYLTEEIRITPFGTLVQSVDKGELDKNTFKVVTKAKPTAEMVEDMIFAWKIAKHAKSNAIVIAKDFKTLGIGQGQTSRVDAFEIALNRACDGSKDAVAASDGFFPAIDNITAAAQGRIAAIIQPGGSIKDEEVIKTADKYNIAMITTGIRHFRH
ncbi:MAG: bifunctional phosphoribosylaminoimidazolecarboxamide formyltransferase/IMP cyclohydrolase [Candidatus Gastranaerophilales bacterium]|nr:bifunctional phosphoribosylaminoimidazolecarboxamide formyltransferase/IMP cyclohydrolase [Candidatus Gastranaerophilales bacterium]